MNNKYIVNFYDWLNTTYIDRYNKNPENVNKIMDVDSAKVCSNDNSYKVLMFQPKAELNVDASKGLTPRSDLLKHKMNQFVSMALNDTEMYSLVLTPEYSVPLDVVKLLLGNTDKISTGTLFCLCCESVSVTVMNEFLSHIKQEYNDNVILCDIAWEELNQQATVCCLMYVLKIKFKLNNYTYFEKTFAIPQFKITPMKDPNMLFEKNGLSCGKNVFEFGKSDEVKFLSVICADVFNFKLLEEIKSRLDSNKVLVFNPQMNKKPQNDYFRFMRNMLFSFSDTGNIKLISLNWAKDTKFFSEDNYIGSAVDNSWSSFYEKFNKDFWRKYLEVFDENAYNGLNIAHDYHLIMYFLDSAEQILNLSIENFMKNSLPEDVQKTIPVKINKSYVYDDEVLRFVEKKEFCKKMINSFFRNEKEFKPLINCDKCNGKCSASKINEFVGSLNININTIDEFKILDDGKVTSVTAKHYKSIFSREKVYLCKRILNKMRTGLEHPKFNPDGIDFEYNIAYPQNEDSPLFNTQYIKNDTLYKFRVLYLKYTSFQGVEKIHHNLLNKFGNKTEDFIIFYEDVDSVKFYKKNFDTSIVAKQTVKSEIA